MSGPSEKWAMTDAQRATVERVTAEHPSPRVVGWRQTGKMPPTPSSYSAVEVRVYRDVDHDERGVWMGEGTVQIDGSLYWYVEPIERTFGEANG